MLQVSDERSSNSDIALQHKNMIAGGTSRRSPLTLSSVCGEGAGQKLASRHVVTTSYRSVRGTMMDRGSTCRGIGVWSVSAEVVGEAAAMPLPRRNDMSHDVWTQVERGRRP